MNTSTDISSLFFTQRICKNPVHFLRKLNINVEMLLYYSYSVMLNLQ